MNRITPILFALLASSCTTIYFDQAQPKKVKELSSFPHEIKGWYSMDSDTFMIEETHYSFPVVYENSYTLSEIDTNDQLMIKDGLFYDQTISYKEGLAYTISNDSLHYKKHIRGSKFLSDSLKLKRFKEYYVLSELSKETKYWTVMILNQNEDTLVLSLNGKLKSKDDVGSSDSFDGNLKDFSKICKFKEIEKNTYLVNPSKKQFNKLIKANLFSVELDLIRISEKSD